MIMSMCLYFLVLYVMCLEVQASWLTDSENIETRVINVNGRENSSYLSENEIQEMIYNNRNNSRRQRIRNAYVPFNSLTFSEDTLSAQDLKTESTEEPSLPWWKNIKKSKSTSNPDVRKTITAGSSQTTALPTVKSKTTFKPMFTTSVYFPSPTYNSSIVKVTEIFEYAKKNTGSNEGYTTFSEGPLSDPQDLTTENSMQWRRDANKNKSTSNPFMKNFTPTATSIKSTSKSTVVPTFTVSIYSPSPTIKTNIMEATEIFQKTLKNVGSNKGPSTFSDTSYALDLTTESTEESSPIWWRNTKKNKLTLNPYVHKTNPASTTTGTTSTSRSISGSTFAASNYYHLPIFTEREKVTGLHRPSDAFLSQSSLSKLMPINPNMENLKWSPPNTPNSPIMLKQKSSNINTLGEALNNEDISTGMIHLESFTCKSNWGFTGYPVYKNVLFH